MVNSNKIQPSDTLPSAAEAIRSISRLVGVPDAAAIARPASREPNDLDSLSTIGIEESFYLKLKPFSRLDPTLVRLLSFLSCFGLTLHVDKSTKCDKMLRGARGAETLRRFSKLAIMLTVVVVSGEVVYDVNLRQSKLLEEQKRSTPLLTFVIVAYSWLSLVIPLVCDLSLVVVGPHLFRFYSRTTATVCNGMFFGKKTQLDTWYYYTTLVLVAFLDVVGQVLLIGVWPESVGRYVRMISDSQLRSETILDLSHSSVTNSSAPVPPDGSAGATRPMIRAYMIDTMLGEDYAHSDLGVCIKMLCLMIQFIHSYALLTIIISLSHHYATVINSINGNLAKYEFRRLLRQLIILRDSSEQISLVISIPFSLVTTLIFMRQIALNGVLIQSTMRPYENYAVILQSSTCVASIVMVFIYCDGLQSASKQTHRLKTEQTVMHENRGGNQSIYEFLDYLDRLTKSIRVTFFNIIPINKSSLVGFFGHILTLIFVTS